MKDFYLSDSTLQAYLQQERPLDALVEQARAALAQGGKMVVLNERHDPPVVIEVVRTAEQLGAWTTKLKRHLTPEAAGRPPDGLFLYEKPKEVGPVEHLEVTERTVVADGAGGTGDGARVEATLVHVLFSTPGRVRRDGNYFIVGPGGQLIHFAIERARFDGTRTVVEGIRLG